MIYYLIFLEIFIFSLVEITYKKLKPADLNVIFICLCGILVLFSGFREVGFDMSNYRYLYGLITFSNYEENTTEIGYAALLVFCRSIALPFNVFLFIIACTSISIKAWFIRKYSPYWILSLLIYFSVNFLLSDMGQIRHGLAMSFVLLGIHEIINRRPIRFYFWVGIAFLFHASAIIVLPAYIIATSKYKITPAKAGFLLALGMIFVFVDIKAVLLDLVLTYVPIQQIQSKISYYVDSEEFGSRLGFGPTMFLRLVLISLMFAYHKRAVIISAWYDVLMKLYIYGTLLYLLFNSIAELALRLSNYFKILEFIIIPIFLLLAQDYYEKLLYLLIIVLYCSWSLYKILGDPIVSLEYLPYKTFLLRGFY